MTKFFSFLLLITLCINANAQKKITTFPRLNLAGQDSIVVGIDTIVSADLADTSLVQHYLLQTVDDWRPTRADSSYRYSTLPFLVIFTPKDKDITYKPTNPTAERINNLQRSLNANQWSSAVPVTASPIRDAKYNYALAHPDAVQYTHRTLPDPDRDIREGRTIRRDEREQNRRLARSIGPELRNWLDSIRAQRTFPVSPWTHGGQENMQASQLFLENWASGGESSISFTNDFSYYINYKTDKQEWENTFANKMGFTRTETLGTRVSDDKFELTTKYGYKAVNNWFYSVKFSFNTQLFRKYKSSDEEKENPTSTFLSPTYLQTIIGMDYKKDDLSILMSPLTRITTIVVDTNTVDQTQYSIDYGKKAYSMNGLSVTATWKKKIPGNILYTTQCEVFYEYFNKKGQKRLNWENVFDLQINRFLSTRVLLVVRYYENESKKFQIKENISIAFQYNLT